MPSSEAWSGLDCRGGGTHVTRGSWPWGRRELCWCTPAEHGRYHLARKATNHKCCIASPEVLICTCQDTPPDLLSAFAGEASSNLTTRRVLSSTCRIIDIQNDVNRTIHLYTNHGPEALAPQPRRWRPLLPLPRALCQSNLRGLHSRGTFEAPLIRQRDRVLGISR